MPKQAIHNEWFMSSSYTKCECGQTKKTLAQGGKDAVIWIWGEYVTGKWRRVETVCEVCFPTHVIPKLKAHATPCGCTFVLNARSGYGPLAPWIKLPDDFNSCSVKGKAA